MTIEYMAAKETDSNRVLGIGIAGEQGGKDYPIQGEPKNGIWIDYRFTMLPTCTEGQHFEFNEIFDGFIVVEDIDEI